MLDPYIYRASESFAKSAIPSWHVSRTHNVDHFQNVGFPVRINTYNELRMIIDTMQENRVESYMKELGGLNEDDYETLIKAAIDFVEFQGMFFSNRQPVIAISTLISNLAIYKKIISYDPNIESVLEIGPGCGYISFFLKNQKNLKNYSQIEAAESFYILQSLVNMYCFGGGFRENAEPQTDFFDAADYYSGPQQNLEISPIYEPISEAPVCTHYPWWRIGQLVSTEKRFKLVMANANLHEFNDQALVDYLSLISSVLEVDGALLVQCTGDPSGRMGRGMTTFEELLNFLFEKGFAPLITVQQGQAVTFPVDNMDGPERKKIEADPGNLPSTFAVNNCLFVRPGHPLHSKYYHHANLYSGFIAPEEVVYRTFFKQPGNRKGYKKHEVIAEITKRLNKSGI
jgi:hypothetical protein